MSRKSILKAIFVLIGLLFLFALIGPELWDRPLYAPRAACINNLRVIDAAKNGWALENGRTNGTITWTNITQFLWKDSKATNPPACPKGGKYTLGDIGELPKCSIKDHILAISPFSFDQGAIGVAACEYVITNVLTKVRGRTVYVDLDSRQRDLLTMRLAHLDFKVLVLEPDMRQDIRGSMRSGKLVGYVITVNEVKITGSVARAEGRCTDLGASTDYEFDLSKTTTWVVTNGFAARAATFD